MAGDCFTSCQRKVSFGGLPQSTSAVARGFAVTRIGGLSGQSKKCIHLAVRVKHCYRDIRTMLVNLLYKERRISLFEIPDVRQELSIRQRLRATVSHRWADRPIVTRNTPQQTDQCCTSKACRSYSASYPAALKKFRHSSMEKRPTISPNAFVTASKLRAARFRSKVLSLENAISIGFKSGE